jgi:hypothetical protein
MKLIVVRPLLIDVYTHSKAVTLLDILVRISILVSRLRSGYHAGASPNSFNAIAITDPSDQWLP